MGTAAGNFKESGVSVHWPGAIPWPSFRSLIAGAPSWRTHERFLKCISASYFNRKLLVTTVTLESAIAADASIGESSPSAATGMPITL